MKKQTYQFRISDHINGWGEVNGINVEVHSQAGRFLRMFRSKEEAVAFARKKAAAYKTVKPVTVWR